jgi:hypothetical protein
MLGASLIHSYQTCLAQEVAWWLRPMGAWFCFVSHPGLPSGANMFRSFGAGAGRLHSIWLLRNDGDDSGPPHGCLGCRQFAGEGARATLT